MLEQILARTPVWVWPLLGFLVYRGIVASVDREVGLRKVFIIPVVMLAMSLQGIASAFGTELAAGPVWLAFTIAGTLLTLRVFDGEGVAVFPERGSVGLRGSWTTMTLIMGIFLTKYAVNAAVSLHPELKLHLGFIAMVCALYGLFNGIFIGQLLRIVSIYRDGIARRENFL